MWLNLLCNCALYIVVDAVSTYQVLYDHEYERSRSIAVAPWVNITSLLSAMNDLLPLTQLIYSSWLLSQPDDRSLPTAPGVLDHALSYIAEKGSLPEWAREQLHFVDGQSGLRCLEVLQIQKLATEAKITEEPNPSYIRSEIVMSPLLARRCLAQLKVAETSAQELGRALREAATRASELLAPAHT
jgi:hypothetical protein